MPTSLAAPVSLEDHVQGPSDAEVTLVPLVQYGVRPMTGSRGSESQSLRP
jgi:hypothetical protein